MLLVIDPLDVLFFRDSKPFAAGESHRAKSAFPPGPFPLVGALRSAIISEELRKRGKGKTFDDFNKGGSEFTYLRDAIGSKDGYGSLVFRGPFLVKKNEKKEYYDVYFPLPMDVVEVHTHAQALKPLKLEEYSGLGSRQPFLPPLWIKQEGAGELKDMFIRDDGLGLYLQGHDPANLAKAEDLYGKELRVGIQLDLKSHTAKEGMLYMAEFIRLGKKEVKEGQIDKVGFLVELKVRDDLLSKSGFLSLGGEGRAAYYEKIKDSDFEKSNFQLLKEGKDFKEKVVKLIGNTKRVKLYLASPAIFKNGWVPDFIDKSTYEGEVSCNGAKVKLKLVSAAIGKPVHIGGWDLAEKAPKTMWKVVPAGSIYYFELLNGTSEDAFKCFHFETALQKETSKDDFKKLKQIGFGLTFVGVWNCA